MVEFINNSYKLRLLLGGLLIIASLLLLPFLMGALHTDKVAIVRAEPSTSGMAEGLASSSSYSDPNAVASGLGALADAVGKTISATEDKIVTGTQSFTSKVASAARTSARVSATGTTFVLSNLGQGIVSAATGVSNAFVFVMQLPAKSFAYASGLPSFSAVIRPADNIEVPVIDSQLAELYGAKAGQEQLSHSDEAEPHIEAGAIWPIHGRITTKFGVPHRPYQVTHTGLDISSGNRSGVMAIKPFRAGKVLETVHSRQGLGNHLIIDHGDGVTSVYAHMYSISVQKGQQVDVNTVLGYEGSTGVSTGTHLHFEVRLNGQPVDPQQYLANQP